MGDTVCRDSRTYHETRHNNIVEIKDEYLIAVPNYLKNRPIVRMMKPANENPLFLST